MPRGCPGSEKAQIQIAFRIVEGVWKHCKLRIATCIWAGGSPPPPPSLPLCADSIRISYFGWSLKALKITKCDLYLGWWFAEREGERERERREREREKERE